MSDSDKYIKSHKRTSRSILKQKHFLHNLSKIAKIASNINTNYIYIYTVVALNQTNITNKQEVESYSPD